MSCPEPSSRHGRVPIDDGRNGFHFLSSPFSFGPQSHLDDCRSSTWSTRSRTMTHCDVGWSTEGLHGAEGSLETHLWSPSPRTFSLTQTKIDYYSNSRHYYPNHLHVVETPVGGTLQTTSQTPLLGRPLRPSHIGVRILH